MQTDGRLPLEEAAVGKATVDCVEARLKVENGLGTATDIFCALKAKSRLGPSPALCAEHVPLRHTGLVCDPVVYDAIQRDAALRNRRRRRCHCKHPNQNLPHHISYICST